MVFCVQGRLGFSSSARRTTFTNAVTSALSGKTRWGQDEAVNYDARPRMASANAQRVAYRFTTRANADSFYNSVISALTTTTPVAGSWLHKHDCNSDGDGACVVTVRRDW